MSIVKKIFKTIFFKNSRKSIANVESVNNSNFKKIETLPIITNRIENQREEYRISDEDTKYFLLSYFVIIVSGGVGLLLKTAFLLKWNIIFFGLLILPFFALDIKKRYITRKRKIKYAEILAKETKQQKYQNLFTFFAGNESDIFLKKFELIKMVTLDTKYALSKLHEVKRFAIKEKCDAIIDLKFNNDGTSTFILANKKS